MRRLLLSILSGLLLSFSWPYVGYYGFIFIAFVPLLILESSISRDSSNRSLKIFDSRPTKPPPTTRRREDARGER